MSSTWHPTYGGRTDRAERHTAGCGRRGAGRRGCGRDWKDGPHDRPTLTEADRRAPRRMPRTSRCAGPTWTPTRTSTTCSSCGCSRTPASSPSATGSTAGARPTGRCSTRACSCRGTRSSTAGRSASGTSRSRSSCGSRGSAAPASTSPTSSPTPTGVGRRAGRHDLCRRRDGARALRLPHGDAAAHAPRRARLGARARRWRCAVPPPAAVTRADTVTEIDFGDPRAVSDLATFVGRAKQANPEGAVRLQLVGPLLVTTVAVHRGLGAARRGHRARPAGRAGRLGGRARHDGVARGGLRPPRARRRHDAPCSGCRRPSVRVPWAALAAPRSGWEPVGSLACEDIDSIARHGISQVAEGTPDGAGGQAVAALRRRVWSAMSDYGAADRRGSRLRRARARLHRAGGAGGRRGPRPVDPPQHVARSRARALTPPAPSRYAAQRAPVHAPRSTRTSLSTSMRSLTRPSTPRSSSRCISSASSIVQTWTCLP